MSYYDTVLHPEGLGMHYLVANRFEDFFEEGGYIVLKNYLYNYLLRTIAVQNSLQNERLGWILEIGSGISPVMTRTNCIVYSDLSLRALKILKRTYGKGWYVVGDCMCLPFKPAVFSHAICSEVLEHLEDDWGAIKELARVIGPAGRLVVTFPHKRFYFANDDRFVGHFRRYELHEMADRLRDAGLRPIYTKKVLGPLEKVTMCFVVFCFSMIQKFTPKKLEETQSFKPMNAFASFFKWANRFYMGLAWLDAKIMPRAFSTVLLIKAEKNHRDDN